jgi:hypothetical protein
MANAILHLPKFIQMKSNRVVFVLCCLLSVLGASAQVKPDDPELYRVILEQDSLFFNSYNTCKLHLKEYSDYYSDSLEFYHDKGGFSASKKDVVEATKKNICGKVTRELIRGSVEVYPIPGFGAIEVGFHQFHNSEEPNATPHPGRFVLVWKKLKDRWIITRVISTH